MYITRHGGVLLGMASRSDADYVSLAKEWAKSSNYKLESIEEGNKKFTFKCNAISFYVFAPENETEGWVRILSAHWSFECFTLECMEQQ